MDSPVHSVQSPQLLGPLSPFYLIIEHRWPEGRGLLSDVPSAPVKKKKKKTSMGDKTDPTSSRHGGTTAVVFGLKPRHDACWDTRQEVMSPGTGESRGERMGSNSRLFIQQHLFKIRVN